MIGAVGYMTGWALGRAVGWAYQRGKALGNQGAIENARSSARWVDYPADLETLSRTARDGVKKDSIDAIGPIAHFLMHGDGSVEELIGNGERKNGRKS